MSWDIVWRTWYCLGRQQFPGVRVRPEAFEVFLARHREAVLAIKEEPTVAVGHAYLVAGTLVRDQDACSALLGLPAQEGQPLNVCLERVARKRCPQGYQKVVADFIGSWFYGTPKRSHPLIARWAPTGDFTRFCLVSIKRLAQAEQTHRKGTIPIPKGFDPVESGTGVRSSAPEGAAMETVQEQIPEFVECFISRLSERCCFVVAIASQLQLNQKQVAQKLGVSEATIHRDIQRVVKAQTECIDRMHLQAESEQDWWWADVRWVAAEHSSVRSAVQRLLPENPAEEDGEK